MEKGFNNQLYVQKQTERILQRIGQFGNKLYLEFGGKLFDDLHAARVLPGFDPNAKVKILQKLKDQAEIIFCINAADIERNKIRADFGITYGQELMRVIDNLRGVGIYVSSIVITQYADQPAAASFRKKLEMHGEKVYFHRHTKGYPADVATIVSEEGYGQNPYIPTTRPLVVVTAPGPGSGKLATCLNQLYHENKHGVRAGYAKFETFPVWNLPLKHPVNVAYEAATADLNDVNMIDYFHLEKYGETTVNYNRDLAAFPVLKTILYRITGEDLYQSPTDMGVNMVGYGITNDEIVCNAAKQEVIRRYYTALCEDRTGNGSREAVEKLELLMKDLDLQPLDRAVVGAALRKSQQTGVPAVAIELPDGTIVAGKQNKLLSATSGAVLNALKAMGDVADPYQLLAPKILEPIMALNKNVLKIKKATLSLEETLITLSIAASVDFNSLRAFNTLPKLRGCQVHSSHLLQNGDLNFLRKLGVNVTMEPKYYSDALYLE